MKNSYSWQHFQESSLHSPLSLLPPSREVSTSLVFLFRADFSVCSSAQNFLNISWKCTTWHLSVPELHAKHHLPRVGEVLRTDHSGSALTLNWCNFKITDNHSASYFNFRIFGIRFLLRGRQVSQMQRWHRCLPFKDKPATELNYWGIKSEISPSRSEKSKFQVSVLALRNQSASFVTKAKKKQVGF